MMALVRLGILVIVVELVFYGVLTIYLRSLHREHLEERWDAQHPDRSGPTPERAAHVEAGMALYRRSLRSRLLTVLLVLPFVAIMAIVYVVNYSD